MKSSQVFLEAAKRIRNTWSNVNIGFSPGNTHSCCCDCISQIRFDSDIDRSSTKELTLFKALFDERSQPYQSIYWWQNPIISNEDQEARKLALLFAAEFAKDIEFEENLTSNSGD